MSIMDDEMIGLDDIEQPNVETNCANCGLQTAAPPMRTVGDFVACEHCDHDVHTRQTFSDWASLPVATKTSQAASSKLPTAPEFLTAAAAHMQNRAATYDKSGERSMEKTVAGFNAITGQNLTEEQGWLLLGVLKMVRSQQGNYKADNYEDEAAYAALRGECAARERQQ